MKTEYILTKEECLAKGGHVWDDFYVSLTTSLNGISTNGIPTEDSPNYRLCKYCGHQQKGYYPPMIWEDVEGK